MSPAPEIVGSGPYRETVVARQGARQDGQQGTAARLAWGSLTSPVGDLHVACSPDGVARVSFGRPPRAAESRDGRPPGRAQDADPGSCGPARDLVPAAVRQLTEYFSGQRRAFELPVDWSGTSAAQQQVLTALQTAAGYGQTVSYGELARLAGLPGSADRAPAFPPARVVGQVMGSNPCPVIVPCHRVVAGNGLGGYSGGAGVEIKRWLLIFEGALPPTLDWDPAGVSGPATA